MPIIESAKKALRGSLRKQEFNLARKTAIKNGLKKFAKLIAEKKADEARKLLPEIQKALDKAVKTRLIKKNNASRKKSRLSAALKKIS